ncbi:MAG: HAMP domain-containing histidine kinase [Planctomycetes bacterium]|nr:HAMP domain-containing histidine kinase [Planctomycetota bacterium]
MQKSARYALTMALAYGLVSSLYIVYSGRIAAELAGSVEDLRRIEEYKGIGFVVVTTLLVFVAGLFAMRRILHDADELARRERAIVANQGKIFAGMMAAAVAHDANNTLTTVLGELSSLGDGGGAFDRSTIDRVHEAIDHLVGLNRRLVAAALRNDDSVPEFVDIGQTVREAVRSLRRHESARGCEIKVTCSTTGQIETRPILVHQIVSNLVLNAAEAAGRGGKVVITVGEHDDFVQIDVEDSGPDIQRERWPTLFESLTTTKKDGNGLGLFSVRSCTEGLGGSVGVGDSALGGAMLRVRIPTRTAPVAAV